MGSKTLYLDANTEDLIRLLCESDKRTPSNLVQYLVGQEWLRRHPPIPSPSLKGRGPEYKDTRLEEMIEELRKAGLAL